jgi:hypothetical protein
VVIFVFLATSVITWISLIRHSKKIRTDIGDANSMVYDGILFNSAVEVDDSEEELS